ncbi:putative Transposable element Tc1 transposase-like 44 [Homarus americanus]|uniref:Putative Transposable element Tc1 transposase-like 44 n=1 Tax=Homarus americanus TaxID=6706 RepID=A0A8J5MX18_HOMAM|nr:putative Transposable element Tc1 transposase-like 44 [Homarus americanus]
MKRRSRPRLTTRDKDTAIIAAIQNNPLIAVDIRGELHFSICPLTVRLHLHEAGIQHRVPAIKEQLTFASTNHGKINLWQPNRTRYDMAHIYEVARSGHVACGATYPGRMEMFSKLRGGLRQINS